MELMVRKILFTNGLEAGRQVTVVEYENGYLGIHRNGTPCVRPRPASQLATILEDYTFLTSPVFPQHAAAGADGAARDVRPSRGRASA